jgi:hypothetical protein
MKKLSLLIILLMSFLFVLNAQVAVNEDGSAGVLIVVLSSKKQA